MFAWYPLSSIDLLLSNWRLPLSIPGEQKVTFYNTIRIVHVLAKTKLEMLYSHANITTKDWFCFLTFNIIIIGSGFIKAQKGTLNFECL